MLLKVELLEAPFLVLQFSCYTLMSFQMMLLVILLPMTMILLSTLSVIRHLICWNNFPAGTRRPEDVPWRSPKGPKVRDFQRTFRRLLGDQHKNWWLNEKVFFICNSPCFTHLLLFFLLEKQIFKSSKWGRSRDVYRTQLRDVQGTKWWDVPGMSAGRRSYMFFKFNSETY